MNNFCFNQDQCMVHLFFISFEFLVTHHFFDVLVSLLLLLTEKGPWALSASVDGPGTQHKLEKTFCLYKYNSHFTASFFGSSNKT